MKWYHSFPELKIKGAYHYKHQSVVKKSIPKDLTNKTVLDLGAWDGYYSFVVAQHNAKVVIAVDNCRGEKDFFGGNVITLQEKYNYLKSHGAPNVNFIPMDVLDVDKIKMKFDLILCLGLYYHLPDFYGLLEECYRKCRGMMLIEGLARSGDFEGMYFLDESELNNDPTNYWYPTTSCMAKILNRVGFKEIEYDVDMDDTGRMLFKCYKRRKYKWMY